MKLIFITWCEVIQITISLDCPRRINNTRVTATKFKTTCCARRRGIGVGHQHHHHHHGQNLTTNGGSNTATQKTDHILMAASIAGAQCHSFGVLHHQTRVAI